MKKFIEYLKNLGASILQFPFTLLTGLALPIIGVLALNVPLWITVLITLGTFLGVTGIEALIIHFMAKKVKDTTTKPTIVLPQLMIGVIGIIIGTLIVSFI